MSRPVTDLALELRARDSKVQAGMERMRVAIRTFAERVEQHGTHVTLTAVMQWPEYQELVAAEREWGR
jgi:hypothetical protein